MRSTPERLTARTRRAAALLVLSLLIPCAARAAGFTDDLVARRARLMDRLGADTILILWSAPVRTYSLDIEYEYRQDSNLYYLTGIEQPDTILVLMPGNRSVRELLFVKEKDSGEEHWDGHALTRKEAAALTGVRTVFTRDRFDAFAAAVLGRREFDYINAEEASAFFDALANGRAHVAIAGDAEAVDAPLTPPLEFARRARERFPGFLTIDATPLLRELRLIKTPYEQVLLKKSVDITVDGHLAGMRAARPGAFEYQVKAAVEAVFRGSGARSPAYPSIVGSGPNSTILHYPGSDRQMNAGDLLVVDAGANYAYMAADVTRAYPVSGTFTAAQRDIYDLVLQAQDEGIRSAAAGGSLAAIHNKIVEVLNAGLLKLGLITDTGSNQYKMWFTHGATHYLGVDVHDPGDRNLPLKAGMAFAVEPGLYIRSEALDALPRTPDNAALIDRIRPVVKKYAGIGVRLEDSFLFDETGLHQLSSRLPRSVQDVEAFMRKRTQP